MYLPSFVALKLKIDNRLWLRKIMVT